MSRLSGKWQRLIMEGLKRRAMTRRRLAELTGIDAGYVTLMTRDGMIPGRDVARRCAKVLGINVEEALLVAGYSNKAIAKAWRERATA